MIAWHLSRVALRLRETAESISPRTVLVSRGVIIANVFLGDCHDPSQSCYVVARRTCPEAFGLTAFGSRRSLVIESLLILAFTDGGDAGCPVGGAMDTTLIADASMVGIRSGSFSCSRVA